MFRKNKKFIGLVLLSLVLIVGGLLQVRHIQASRTLDRLEKQAAQAPEKTLQELSNFSIPKKLWTRRNRIKLQCYVQLKKADESAWLYLIDNSLFEGQEESSLLAGHGLLQAGRMSELNELLQRWNDGPAWLLLKSDSALRDKKYKEALEILLASQFEGSEEAERLMRLAVFAKEEKVIWKLLQGALKADPANPEVRHLRGRYLERKGLLKKALAEYRFSKSLAPEEALHHRRLIQFHLRQRNLDLALAAWDRAPETLRRSTGFRFLSSMVRSEQTDNTEWASLLKHLELGEEPMAKLTFRNLGDARRLDPLMVWGLEQVFAYKSGSSWQALDTAAEVELSSHHRFFTDLKHPEALDPILKSEHAYSALFLAGGWREAALRTSCPEVVPTSYPDWYAYALARAIQSNRGVEDALKFVRANRIHLGCRVLEGELLLAKGEKSEALRVLLPLAKLSTPEGSRACWLAAQHLLEGEHHKEALSIVRGNSMLMDSNIGKELSARLLSRAGHTQQSIQAYTEISETSIEAAVVLARQAYAQGDLEVARSFTLKALNIAPEAPQLWSNLRLLEKGA